MNTIKPPVSIRILKVNFAFRSSHKLLWVLNKLSFTIEQGEFVAIVGPSGCGKTTLLRLIAGILDPNNKDLEMKGEIFVNNLEPIRARKNREIGCIFQNPVLLPWRTIKQNIKLPLEILGNMNEKGRKADEVLRLMRLTDFVDAYPHELSHGMNHKVSIARALIFKPSILLMDEPFSGLDEITREKLTFELMRICHETKCTALYITHNVPEAVFLADKVVVLSKRPAKLVQIYRNDFARPRTPELRNEPKVLNIVEKVRQCIDSEFS